MLKRNLLLFCALKNFADDRTTFTIVFYATQDCSKLAFAELLSVVHPSSKPIDNDNVAMLLELARLWIMPTVCWFKSS